MLREAISSMSRYIEHAAVSRNSTIVLFLALLMAVPSCGDRSADRKATPKQTAARKSEDAQASSLLIQADFELPDGLRIGELISGGWAETVTERGCERKPFVLQDDGSLQAMLDLGRLRLDGLRTIPVAIDFQLFGCDRIRRTLEVAAGRHHVAISFEPEFYEDEFRGIAFVDGKRAAAGSEFRVGILNGSENATDMLFRKITVEEDGRFSIARVAFPLALAFDWDGKSTRHTRENPLLVPHRGQEPFLHFESRQPEESR